MNRIASSRHRLVGFGCLLLIAATTPAGAQAPQAAPGVAASTPTSAAPAPAARAAEFEPAVDTSAPVAAPAASPAAPTPAAGVAPARSAAPGAAAAKPDPQAQPAAARRAVRAMDRVELDASQITGNRELPRVLYIVPWRAPEAGDLEGRPVNSLLYELTKPVDRDVFRRENRYFDALAAQSPNADASAREASGAGGPEK